VLNNEALKSAPSEDGHPTLESSVHMVAGGLDSLALEIEERANQMFADTAEPLETFLFNFSNQSQLKI
jgi:hypothetical protein